MTVVGSVEVDVLARVDSNTVTRQMAAGLDKPAKAAGQAAGKTMGKHLGDSAATELEKSGARFARSGRLLSNVFTSNSATALGPLQEVADKVELIGSTLDSTKTKAGGMLLGIGAAATGIGAFLKTLESREEGALKRLGASIAATGGDIADYQTRIDGAVKAGERFGYSGNQTIDALQALTIGLHDPKKALDELGLAQDIAAAKQISLSSAANLVRQAYNGNTRVLKAFGIQVADVVDGQKLLADAHGQAAKASSDVAKAQKDYSDKLAIYLDTLKPTLAQQIALKNAHDKLTTATAEQATAQQGLADAQTKANAAGSKGQEVLDKLAKITAGQAAASADTFTGKLKAVGAALEDNAAKVGGHVGTALIEFGPALAAGGFLIESGLLPRIGRGVRGLLGLGGQATATAAEIEGASAAEAASLDTVVVAIRELQTALTGIGPAAAAGAIEVGAATATMDGEIATTTAAAGRLGLVFRGLLGSATLLAGFTFEHSGAKNRIAGNQSLIDAVTGGNQPDPATLTGPYNRHAPQVPDDYDAKTHATSAQRLGIAGKQQHGVPKTPQNPTGDATLQAFLDSIGGGAVANSAASKAISEAQKAAADQAKKLGKTVTDGMTAQVHTVEQAITGLEARLKEISDLRGKVAGQATSFTALSGLLPDNSLATSSSLVGALKSRVGAEKLFDANIAALRRRHVDPAVIQEIFAEGPERARAIAAALAQGSDADIRQLNLAEQAAHQQAQILGQHAVDARFGSGAQGIANRELAKLNAQVAALNKQIAAQPALIAKAVDQAQKNATVTTRAVARRGGSV